MDIPEMWDDITLQCPCEDKHHLSFNEVGLIFYLQEKSNSTWFIFR